MLFLMRNKKDGRIRAAYDSYPGKKGILLREQFNYNSTNPEPIVVRGFGYKNHINMCLADGRDFYFMDHGYFGNNKNPLNPEGHKIYHRIVKNGYQHSEIIDRPSDRWDALKYKIEDRKRGGKHILMVMPTSKPFALYSDDEERWRKETIETIKMYTDRPIIIREKPVRAERISNKSIYEDFKDAHAVVSYQSVAIAEAILHGIPAYGLAPNVADPIMAKDLSTIEDPYFPDKDLIHKWACHAAYGQFSIPEIMTGKVWEILNN